MFADLIHAHSEIRHGNMGFNRGEVSDVVKARCAFFDEHSLSIEDAVAMHLEHDDMVEVAIEADRGQGITDPNTTIRTEALITNTPGLILFLTTADCLPISFYDQETKTIALAHLGWKPTDLGLTQKVIEKMSSEFNVDPQNVHINIGPGIHKESYTKENPAQRDDPKWKPYLQEIAANRYAIDIIGFNKNQLLEAGVLEKNIEINPENTATSRKYFSHYRGVTSGNPEGVFATILGLPTPS